MPIVLDCSAVIAMCFEDEDDAYAERLFEFFVDSSAIAPSIWPLEVCNSLLTAVRRNRLVKAEANHFFRLIASLPVEIVASESSLERYGTLFELAAEYDLSSYDAAYLLPAMERGLPLATLDRRLKGAAAASGVRVFGS